MSVIRTVFLNLMALLLTALGAAMAFSAPLTASSITYFQTETANFVQAYDVGFAARAQPFAAANVTDTGGVTVMHVGALAVHGQETVAALFGFGDDLNATNSEPRFVTDAAGNTIDANATKNLTSLSPSDVNFQAGRGSPTFDSNAAPNSYANLGNGHAIVYGPDGRALYDVSAGRVKVVVWNTNPSTGQSFPNWGSDSKAFVGNVPQSLLDDLGLN